MSQRDYAFEALAEVTSTDWNAGRGELNAALKSIREQTPEITDGYILHVEIHDRAKAYRQMFGDGITLTPSALAKHWKRVIEARPKPTATLSPAVQDDCPTCGGDKMIWVSDTATAPCPDCNAGANVGSRRKPQGPPPVEPRLPYKDSDEPPPPLPPVGVALPEIPRGRGLTAHEAAEILVPNANDWRKRETIRRRAQELEEPLRLLEVIGVRPGAETGKDNQVYDITESGRTVLQTWDRGEPVQLMLHPLVRPGDPETAQAAAQTLKPDTDRHRVLKLYAQRHDQQELWNE